MILQNSLFPPESSWTVPDVFPQFSETETVAIVIFLFAMRVGAILMKGWFCDG